MPREQLVEQLTNHWPRNRLICCKGFFRPPPPSEAPSSTHPLSQSGCFYSCFSLLCLSRLGNGHILHRAPTMAPRRCNRSAALLALALLPGALAALPAVHDDASLAAASSTSPLVLLGGNGGSSAIVQPNPCVQALSRAARGAAGARNARASKASFTAPSVRVSAPREFRADKTAPSRCPSQHLPREVRAD